MGDKPQRKTRDGPHWKNDAYEAVITAIVDNDLDPSDIASMSEDQINAFTSKIYERFGDDRRRRCGSLKTFFHNYHDQILEDCQRFKRDEKIVAPKRRALIARIDQVARAIDSCTQGQNEIQQFIENSEFELAPELRKIIYNSLKGTGVAMSFKKMNHLLDTRRRRIVKALNLSRQMNVTIDAAQMTSTNDVLYPLRANENLPPLQSNSRVLSSKIDPQIVRSRILSGFEKGLEKVPIPGKGMGVKATRNFAMNEYIVEYTGELISETEARQRMTKYAEDESFGNFLLSFRSNNQTWCIDATKDNGRLGRWINHSKKNSNAENKTIVIDARPHVFLVASREITAGEEILYDYRERNPDTIKNNPWLLE